MSSSEPLVTDTYDEIYIQSWQAALKQCEDKLERQDHTRALLVKSADDFRAELRHLQIEFPAVGPQEVILLLFPASEHYETFAKTFVAMMKHKVDISMLWGLLFLVIKLSLESDGTIERISRMLKGISHKLQLLNEIHTTITDFSKVKAETVEINREMVILWLNIIMIFRTQSLNTTAWELLTNTYNIAIKNIEAATKRVEDITYLSSRQSKMIDLAMFHNALSLGKSQHSAKFPCHTIPVARNKGFFGREEVLTEISQFFSISLAGNGMSSLAIFGLGGIGKSQTALEYAWRKQSELDTVLWVPAENEISIQQGLSLAATKALMLPDAEPQSHQQNAVLVMEWLKNTDAKWLLVYDNVESPHVFENYWPVSDHGSILVTTRKRGLTSQPINNSIELFEFSPKKGAEFLIHQLPGSTTTEDDPEFKYALDISVKLEGHALAISQMAALINARRYSLEKFIDLYEKHRKKIHRERKAGWKYLGYNHSLDTVWELSFQALEPDAQSCLGILSFLAPDSIPQQLFHSFGDHAQSPGLRFCEDELGLDEVFETLADLALIKIYASTGTISLHRLVQSEFKFHANNQDRQQSFDSAVLLVSQVFPSRNSTDIEEREWYLAERYLPHVLSLLKDFRDSQRDLEPLSSSYLLTNLCCDTLGYLRNNDSGGNRNTVVTTAFIAWEKWESDTKDPLLHTYILKMSSEKDLYIGEFQSAIRQAQETLRILNHNLPPEDNEIVMANCVMGLCWGTVGDYNRGEDFLGRAREVYEADPNRYGWPALLLLNANSARNFYCKGDFQDAKYRLDICMQKALEQGSDYWQGVLGVAYGSLYNRMGDLDSADTHLREGGEAIERFGKNRQLNLNSKYAYHLGRLRLAQGRIPESIEQFEKAIAIDAILLSPNGFRARNIYALSRALSASSDRKAEGVKMRDDAFKIAGKAPSPSSPEDDYWEVFDLLIRITER